MFSVYIYDKTFDGLLTAVFDAYFRKTFPDALLSEGDRKSTRLNSSHIL